MLIIYRLILQIYHLGIHLASLFHPKAKLWVQGRKNIFSRLSKKLGKDENIIWIHCASLGEFEQGRPLIENLKKQYPQHKIFLSFFSPSGYEIRKDYPVADYIDYLPLDTAKNAKRFIEIINPKVAIFVKYEFWYYYLDCLKTKKIPSFLISAIFRKDQIFFKSYGQLFRKMLNNFQHIFVQTPASANLLQNIGIEKLSICGDTRVDRVIDIAKASKDIPLIEAFAENKELIICGSTWEADEKILLPILNSTTDQNRKFILAPHEIKPSKIAALQARIQLKTCKYSEGKIETIASYQVLIIDNIGMLSAIYKYGKIAYIGGGFGKGIHNILEPIAFGLPVIFGPKYQKFEEALRLIHLQAAFSIRQSKECADMLNFLSNDTNYKAASKQAVQFLQENKGATDKIMSQLSKELPKIT